MKKSLVLVIILIIVAISGWYWYSQNNSELRTQNAEVNTEMLATNDWQTYRNEALGLELEYPSSWFVDSDDDSVRFVIQNIDNKPNLDNLGHVTILSSDKTVDDLLREGQDILQAPWMNELGIEKEIPKNQFASNGYDVAVLGPASPPSGMTQTMYAVVSKGKKTVVLISTIQGGSVAEWTSAINKVLSTVNFIEN